MNISAKTTISRREFLLGAAALAFTASSSGSVARKTSRRTQVLVIGAGSAGIAAARRLRELGFEAVILEARRRVGGRVWTPQLRSKTPIDLGASWIHGLQNNPIHAAARAQKLPLFRSDYESYALYQGRQRLSEARQNAIATRFESVMDSLEARRESGAREGSLGAEIEREAARRRLSASQKRELDFAVNTEIEHEYGADAAQLSFLNFDAGAENRGDDVLFPRGFGELFERLARPLDIRFEQRVSRIRHSAAGVEIETQDGSWRADFAVISLPLGVLQSGEIAFEGEFPSEKREAMRVVKMGLLHKVWLEFPRQFWPDEHFFGRIPAQRGQWCEWLSAAPLLRKPVLLGFNAGEFAWRLEAQSDTQIVALAMAALRETFGSRVPAPTDFAISRWGRDPFSRGAYSFLAPGGQTRSREILGQNLAKRLFFAGEATSADFPATVHGAWNSGLRAAQEIADI